jgi:hypothetical protein
MKKTALSIATALSLLIVAGTAANAAQNFPDTNNHWGRNSINAAVDLGYVDGYPDGTFKPDSSVSRAEFVKLVIDALKYMKGEVVSGSNWYKPYLEAAVTNGLTKDGELPTDALNDPISREEMSRVAVRSTGENTDDNLKWMYLATSKGIIQGMDDQGTLGEDQPTTRAQAITVIDWLLKLKAGEKLAIDKYAVSAAEIAWHRTNIYTMAPEYFGSGKDGGYEFKWSKVKFQGAMGYSDVEKYVIVDMGDPLDPNRKLIPDNMRWMMKVGKERTLTQDVPANSYAFLSFNHFVVNTPEPISTFRFATLELLNFKLDTYDNVDSNGNLLNITAYAPLIDNKSFAAGRIPLPAGRNEYEIISGQLAPKNPKVKKGEGGTSIYKMAAVDLGETNQAVIYQSVLTPNAGGN